MSYQDFYNVYVKRHVYKTKKSCQDDVIKLWNTAKQKFPKKEELIHHIQHEIERLLREATEGKVRSTLAFPQKTNSSSIQAGTSTESVPNVECGCQVQINDHNIQHAESAVQDEINDQQSGDQDLDGGPQPAGASKRNTTPSNVRPTPAQDNMKKKITKLHVELDLTERRKRSLVADGTEFDKACNLRREIDICEKKLKLKEKQRMSLETITSVLGPDSVTFLSQDDKAHVPIGLTAANKQAPLLMHVEYKVSLPDHDFVIASRHKLIPSVYALCEVKPNEMGRPEAVSYSGPTYIAIRSGKHSSSTATSHAQDLDTLLTIESFSKCIKNIDSKVKPVLIISSDGGPDENPRYRRSAFNRVERRMAPLSRELTGVVLPHDSFGTHLDSSGRTLDESLEKDNFKKAGDILAEIWSAVCIDGHEVVAEYIDPNNDTSSVPDLPAEEWYTEHVRESQYLLQVHWQLVHIKFLCVPIFYFLTSTNINKFLF
ncbi:hypothetical protein JTB14_020103 [Gonioctena quinquepunctata]|nr:hypothetical protein JTB14_020103 [Gonioctena quinquepunctata]